MNQADEACKQVAKLEIAEHLEDCSKNHTAWRLSLGGGLLTLAMALVVWGGTTQERVGKAEARVETIEKVQAKLTDDVVKSKEDIAEIKANTQQILHRLNEIHSIRTGR